MKTEKKPKYRIVTRDNKSYWIQIRRWHGGWTDYEEECGEFQFYQYRVPVYYNLTAAQVKVSQLMDLDKWARICKENAKQKRLEEKARIQIVEEYHAG